MSGQAGFDASLDIDGLGSVQSSQQIESSFASVGNNLESTLGAQYQSSISDIGVTGAQVSSTYQSTVEQAAATTATTAAYESAFSATASSGIGEANRNVSTYIEPENAYILSVIAGLHINEEMTEKDKLESILNLIINNFTYVADNPEDTWNTVDETLATKSGDCEDLSNLAASLLLAAGFPADKVNVYVDLVGNASNQGHVVVGLMINDQEVKLDFAQLINDKDGNYTQINESFYANNQLNKSTYDFSYSVNGVEKLSASLASTIVLEDATNKDSFYTAGWFHSHRHTPPPPPKLPLSDLPFIRLEGGQYVISGTNGNDNISLSMEGTGTSAYLSLVYNGFNEGKPINLSDYDIPANATIEVRGGSGTNTISRTNVPNVTISDEPLLAPSYIACITSGTTNNLTINGSTAADTVALSRNGTDTMLTYNGAVYNLTTLYGANININLNFNNGTNADSITITDVDVDTITGGEGVDNITLNGSTRVNTINGGTGNDAVTLNGTSRVGTINGGDGADTITLNGYSHAGTINGDAGIDVIALNNNSSAQSINGGLGLDRVTLNNDTLVGDIVETTATGDGISVTSIGNPIIGNVAGNVITNTSVFTEANGVITIHGRSSADTIELYQDTSTGNVMLNYNGLVYDLGKGKTINVDGGAGDDNITVRGVINSTVNINGGTGNDSILALGNSLINGINGGDGNDLIIARDTSFVTNINGEAGNDHIFLQNNAGARNIQTGDGTNTVTIMNDATVISAGVATDGTITGGTGNDTITAQDNAQVRHINTAAGSDTVNLSGNSQVLVDVVGRETDTLNQTTGATINGVHGTLTSLPTTGTTGTTGTTPPAGTYTTTRADLINRLSTLNSSTALPGTIFTLAQSIQGYLDATATQNSTSINSARADLINRLSTLNPSTALPGTIFALAQSAQGYLDLTNNSSGTTPPTGTTGTSPHYAELDAAFNAPGDQGGARALVRAAFRIAVEDVVAVAPPGSTKFEQMIYSMANTIEAMFETLLLMSEYMANNPAFAKQPGDMLSLQRELQQVKDTIATLTAVGSLSPEVLKTHLAQFVRNLNG